MTVKVSTQCPLEPLDDSGDTDVRDKKEKDCLLHRASTCKRTRRVE